MFLKKKERKQFEKKRREDKIVVVGALSCSILKIKGVCMRISCYPKTHKPEI